MFKKTKLVAGISIATATLISQQISAAAFAVNEQSATASGTALAGNAASDTDISFSYWNPALFANAKETTLYINGSYISPSADITNVSGDGFTAAADNINSSEPVDDAIIPAIYLAVPISDKTVLGVSLNVPYALKSEYDEDWSGRYHATNTELQDISLSFSAAHRMNDWIDVGASIQLHSTSMTLDAAVSDFNGTSGDGQGSLEVDDSLSYGYSLGIALEPKEGTRVGIGYRSEVDVNQTGNANYTDLSANATGAGIVDTTISADNTLPSLFTFSVEQELTEDLTLGLTAMRTGWSSVQELRIDFDSTQSDSVLTLNYDDVWFYSVGLTYDYSDDLVLRTGYALDNSPSDSAYLSPRAPGSDRQWISFGGTYDVSEETQIMFSYIRLTSDEVNVSKDATGENQYRGSFSGDYDISANIFSVALNTTF